MKNLALIGLPNAGKTSLFNALCGTKQKVANFPGVTVEKSIGQFSFKDESYQLTDLPGIYSLDTQSLDEKICRGFLFNAHSNSVDLFIIVVDATNIKRSLFLLCQLKELNLPFVVALNLIDLANKRGQVLDLKYLENELAAPVVPIVANQSIGLDSLCESFKRVDKNVIDIELTTDLIKKYRNSDYIAMVLKNVESMVKKITIKKIAKDSLTEKIDEYVLHPVWGLGLLFLFLILIFQLLFVGAEPFMGLIEDAFSWLISFFNNNLPDGLFKSLMIDGFIGGLSGVIVFIPHIFLLYALINFFEDIGYLGRAAFLLDYFMRLVGLPGRAVIPLLSSHACAVPGIMAARIIPDRFQRLVTMMVAPFATCSARLPVYTLLIAAAVPNQNVLGIFNLQGLAMATMYAFGIGSAFMIALIAKNFKKTSSISYLLMEVPAYRLPRMKHIMVGAYTSVKVFLQRAGGIILVLSFIIWLLVSFPRQEGQSTQTDIDKSYAAMIGKTLTPIFAPLGFDWRMTTALIPSFAAREVLVVAMGTVLSVQNSENEDETNQSIQAKLSQEYSLASIFALLVWFVFSPQCMATIAMLKKESGSYIMPMIFVGYSFLFAYFFAFLTFQIVTKLT